MRKFTIGTFLDFSPTFVFIIAFELSDFYTATAWFIVATFFMSVFAILFEKRIPYFSFYISFVTFAFGSWTLLLHDPDFIQMRDTFYDAALAFTLYIGLRRGKLFLKTAFSHSVVMLDTAWQKITNAWIIFFLSGGVANEIARRVLDEGGWIYFKLSLLAITIIFGFWVLFYFYEPKEEEIIS